MRWEGFKERILEDLDAYYHHNNISLPHWRIYGMVDHVGNPAIPQNAIRHTMDEMEWEVSRDAGGSR